MKNNKLQRFSRYLKSKDTKEKTTENIDKIKNQSKKVLNLFDKNKFIDLNDKSRSDTKLAQTVLFAFFISLIFNFMLVVLILIMLPLKEKVPYFVHFMPKEEQIVYVEQYKVSKSSQRSVKEFLARDYVMKRETIDLETESKRWNEIMFFSNNEIKSSFNTLYLNSNDSPYKWAINNNIRRTINIISSSVLSDMQYQVEYEMIDTYRSTGKILKITIAVATVSFEETKEPLKGNDYLNNPFGYLVNDYSIGIKQQKMETEKSLDLKIEQAKKTNKKDTDSTIRDAW